MNTKSAACILAFLTNGKINTGLRLEKLGECVERAKPHKLQLSKTAFLFESIEKANEAVRVAAKEMEPADEFLIFPVEICFGSFSSVTEKKLRECHQESVHVPLLAAGKADPLTSPR